MHELTNTATECVNCAKLNPVKCASNSFCFHSAEPPDI
jgi:hypothetical protein